MWKGGQFPTLAVENENRFHGDGICHRQIAEAAKPPQSGHDVIAVVGDSRLDVYRVGMVEVKFFGDLQVAVTPRECKVGGRFYGIGIT